MKGVENSPTAITQVLRKRRMLALNTRSSASVTVTMLRLLEVIVLSCFAKKSLIGQSGQARRQMVPSKSGVLCTKVDKKSVASAALVSEASCIHTPEIVNESCYGENER